MGRKRSVAVEEKRKALKVRPIESTHAGKIVAVYTLMGELIKAHHAEVEGAKFVLLWRDGWKPDVDKVLKLASCKRATEVERAVLRVLDGVGDYDFVIQLNAEAWPGLSDAKKRQVFDHELYHAAPDLDRNGKQKLDSKEHPCWRSRKHPIQECPQIIQRYGVAEVLNLGTAAARAVEDTTRPLLAAIEKANAGDGEAVTVAGTEKDLGKMELVAVKTPDWRQLSVKQLGLPARYEQAILDKGIHKLGKLSAHIEEQGDFWAREIKGLGPGGRTAVEDAFEKFWEAHPEFCRVLTAALTTG